LDVKRLWCTMFTGFLLAPVNAVVFHFTPIAPPHFMQIISFKLTRPHIALCDLLKLAGIADSGGRGKTMVTEGLVKLNGETELRKTAKIRAGDTVQCEAVTIKIEVA